MPLRHARTFADLKQAMRDHYADASKGGNHVTHFEAVDGDALVIITSRKVGNPEDHREMGTVIIKRLENLLKQLLADNAEYLAKQPASPSGKTKGPAQVKPDIKDKDEDYVFIRQVPHDLACMGSGAEDDGFVVIHIK